MGAEKQELRKKRTRRKHLRRRVEAWIASAVVKFLQIVPAPLWHLLLIPLHPLLLSPRRRRRAAEQLEQILGDRLDARQRRRVLSAMTHHIARIVHEVAHYARARPEFVRALVRPDEKLLEQLAAISRASPCGGAILVTPHFGNFELMPAWFILEGGLRGAVVAKRHVNPFFDSQIHAMRSRNGVETIYQDENPRKLLRLLKTGGIIGILPDQDIKRLPGVFVDFFGRPAYTLSGPANLAIMAGVPIVPAFMIWRGDHYSLSLDEPILVREQADRQAEVLRLTRAWSRAFERVIEAHPDQWVWFHDRWKTTPEMAEQRRRRGRLRSKRVQR